MKGKIVIVVVLLAGLILVACGTGESGSGSEGLAAAVDSINQLSQTAPVNAAPHQVLKTKAGLTL